MTRYRDVQVATRGASLEVRVTIENSAGRTWTPDSFSLGWQFFDPVTDGFILEGTWTPVLCNVTPGQSASFEINIPFPPEAGGYRIYVSPIDRDGWAYAKGEPFLLVNVEAGDEEVRVLGHDITTLRTLRWRRIRRALPRFFSGPLRTIAENRRLIRSMARRDILARYRGSFGDVFWTILNPLLLMATYFFVFGVILGSRFGADQSRTGFALYFLAGM
ncbi:MAG TPA: hypothetical protein VGV35_16735, partial [Bryobacteraceae bacterium]|nr:hypothetical protein [Bryobacteraceae bacterium]